MEEIVVDVSVGEGVSLPVGEEVVERAVRHVLRAEGHEAGEISVAFLDDAAITEINREHLHHDYPTDVISFALHEAGEAPIGDVYVGADQARRQAEELEVEVSEELLRLAVHGTLHVLGHDHPEGPERMESEMFRRQEELLLDILDGAAGA